MVFTTFRFVFVLANVLIVFVLGEDNLKIRSSRASNFCPSHSTCVPISSCPILQDIMKYECVMSNRVTSLGCGFQGSGLVCCPQSPHGSIVRGDKVVDGQVCGQSAVHGDDYEGLGTYPWIARVGFRNVKTREIKFPCTGSILNKRIVLTAGHCALAKAENYKLALVRVGEYATNSDVDCDAEFCGLPVQDIGISHVILHPNYEKHTYKNNIALIVLRSPMNFTVTVQPICLPESWSVTSNNGLLVGWGKLAGQSVSPSKQQVLRLPIVDLRKCVNIYGNTIPISEDHLCAGGEIGKDACSGFGGAPLLVKHSDTYYQIGILSFGSDQCGAQNIPSVYTNLKKYIAWIKQNIPTIYSN